MASPKTIAARDAFATQVAAMAVCGSCGVPMAGPGTCRDCLAKTGARAMVRPGPGTRHVRRRTAGVSRSKAGR